MDGIESAQVRITQGGGPCQDRLIDPDKYKAGQHGIRSRPLRSARARPPECSMHFHTGDD